MPSLRRRALTVAIAAAAPLSLLAACSGSGPSAQQRAAQAFLDAVGRHDANAAAALTDNQAEARTALSASLAGLGSTARADADVDRVDTDGDAASAAYRIRWTLSGVSTPWAYAGKLALRRTAGSWTVVWAPTDVHPQLTATTHLVLTRVQPTRGTLRDAAGGALFTATPVVRVGVEPKLVKDLPGLARTLAGIPALESSAAEITASVRAAASPTEFVPVITLRRNVYETIRDKIHDLDGTVFTETTEPLTPGAHYGQPLLGTVGPATAAVVTASKGRVVASDRTGLGGLQQALDPTLAGTAGSAVVAADGAGATTRTLATLAAPQAGHDATLTLDRATQSAAERALAGIDQQASIVAVNRSTGAVLADANTPTATYDLGLAGALPPGSTFKIATWAAAFTADPALTPSTEVACPATVTVDGRQFENENRFSHPPIPVRNAFGYSCNTSAINAALRLPATALASQAHALGLGATWDLPVDSFSGTLPAPATETERAADAIGQGRVLASPLLMALLAGAATTGHTARPSLLAGHPAAPGPSLPASLVTKMSSLMKATVEPGGTGAVLGDLSGVRGKTGTAEYGNDTPPRSHAWFAGVQGDVAFAVFVYDGASAGIDPSRLARSFLTARS